MDEIANLALIVHSRTQAATSLRSTPAWRWWHIGPVIVGNVGDNSVSNRLHVSEFWNTTAVNVADATPICNLCVVARAQPPTNHGPTCNTVIEYYIYKIFNNSLLQVLLQYIYVCLHLLFVHHHALSRMRSRNCEVAYSCDIWTHIYLGIRNRSALWLFWFLRYTITLTYLLTYWVDR